MTKRMTFTTKHESEFMKRMRAIAQEAEGRSICALCGSSGGHTVAEGRRWFDRHAKTDRHKRAVARAGRFRG